MLGLCLALYIDTFNVSRMGMLYCVIVLYVLKVSVKEALPIILMSHSFHTACSKAGQTKCNGVCIDDKDGDCVPDHKVSSTLTF